MKLQGPVGLTDSRMGATNLFLLLTLTLGALFVHGYHPYAEDAEIYLPGVKKLLHPELYPKGAEFFQSHAGLTWFPNLIAASVRISHLPFGYALFCWQVVSIFLFLLACWRVTGSCFSDLRARWAGTALVAALLTLPIAGTALYIIDQYVVSRNIAAFAGLFAISATLRKRYAWTAAWLVFDAAVHPLMCVFAITFCIILAGMERLRPIAIGLACFLPISIFEPSSTAYHEASMYHASQYLSSWHWYEWLGAVAPIAIVYFMASAARRVGKPVLARVCAALTIYGVVFFAAALVLVPAPETLARLQPLRALHLIYVLLLLMGGGLLGEYALKGRTWAWLVLFLPICTGMFLAQRTLFPNSVQVEWPWSAPNNDWMKAFIWVRDNTPVNAYFALDPSYMQFSGEDNIGFRAVAERSRLADIVKDSGAVVMFPPLAAEWLQQVREQENWPRYTLQDFAALHGKYGVDWIVARVPPVGGLRCPYQNPTVAVCQLD